MIPIVTPDTFIVLELQHLYRVYGKPARLKLARARVAMAAEVIRQEHDSEHRYRITRTDNGYLVTMRSRKGLALWLPAKWLHRTCEAADACLDAVMVTNAASLATRAGHSANDLLRTAEARNATYAQLCDRLNDHPVMGQEVRTLREAVNDSSRPESNPPVA